MIVVPFAFNPLLQGLDLPGPDSHKGAAGPILWMRCWDSPRSAPMGPSGPCGGNMRACSSNWAREPAAPPLGHDRRGGPGGCRLRPRRLADPAGCRPGGRCRRNPPPGVLGLEHAPARRGDRPAGPAVPAPPEHDLRLLEPIGEAEEDDGEADEQGDSLPVRLPEPTGVAITFESVAVRAAGHSILQDVELRVPAGSQVAIVGPSAPASRPWSGSCWAGTVPHPGGSWSRASRSMPLVSDAFGSRPRGSTRRSSSGTGRCSRTCGTALADEVPEMGEVLRGVGLFDVLRHPPQGLQTPLGEGGGLVSGGEGQLVRFGRAWCPVTATPRDPRRAVSRP